MRIGGNEWTPPIKAAGRLGVQQKDFCWVDLSSPRWEEGWRWEGKWGVDVGELRADRELAMEGSD